MGWLGIRLGGAALCRLTIALLFTLCVIAIAQAQAVAVLSGGAPVLTQVTGDGDAFVENFETWRFSIQLTNTGTSTANNVTPFQFTVSALRSCGGNLSWTVIVSTSGAPADATHQPGSRAGGVRVSASGTLRLDLVDDDTTINNSGIPLGGVGPGNGNLTSGAFVAKRPRGDARA